MMKTTYQSRFIWSLVFAIFALAQLPFTPASAQDSSSQKNDAFVVYNGIVRDVESNEPILYATVTLKGKNIATVTNADGEFSLKVDPQLKANAIQITHVGYANKEIAFSEFASGRLHIFLQQSAIPLNEVNIYPNNAEHLVRTMMQHVANNYSNQPVMMKAFYRETIQRNRSHVGIAEAVVDIYKTDYSATIDDQVKIYKGRKTEDLSKMDTLVLRLQGGPATAILMDVIKHPYSLLSPEDFNNYTYQIETVVQIDGKPHFVVAFQQKPFGEFPLYNGKYYIEANTLALTNAEFSLNVSNPEAATRMLIQRKPIGLKVTAKSVNYLVNYRIQDGTWYFNYARGEMDLKMRWKRKLFSTNYSAIIEMAITDRKETEVERFKNTERFKQNQIFTEEVSAFGDADFWGAENTIQPDESIQATIRKLAKKGKF